MILMKILDLFCGAGGFSSGFTKISNGQHLVVDINSNALDTYSLNHPEAIVLQRDIYSLHSTEIENYLDGRPDIIIASPPCEEFSLANPKSEMSAAERIYGEGTARLVLDTIRLIGDLEPSVFVIENVAALVAAGGREIIEREFEKVGFENVHFNMVRAHQHGNPSQRLRLFISNLELDLPRMKAPTVIETIGDLPSLGIDSLLDYRDPVPNHELSIISDRRLKQVRKTPWGRGVKHFKGPKSKILPNWVRLYPDQIAHSIIGLGRFIHPYEDRLLTVREHARLMSYPDSFIFTGPSLSIQFEQVGESVPPLISSLIAQEVFQYIE